MRLLVLLLLAACGGGDDDDDGIDAPPPDSAGVDSPDAPIETTTGAFRLSWSIEQGGAPSTCEAAGGVTVHVQSIPASSTDVIQDRFPCLDGTDLTSDLPIDDYDVSVRLLDAGGAQLGETLALAGAIDTLGQIAPLPPIVFEL